MTRLVSFLLWIAVTAWPVAAQEPAGDPVRAEILAASEKITLIDCDFVQTRESSLLAEAAVSTGHMTYRKPGYLSWSYLTPQALTLTMDGQDMTLEKDGQVSTLNGNQNRLIKEMTRLIISNIEGSVFSNVKLFAAEFHTDGNRIEATLYPKKAEIKRLWSKLILYYDRPTLRVTRFEMHEASGDRTDITFSHVTYAFSE